MNRNVNRNFAMGSMSPFDRLARFVVRRAYLVVVAWAVLVAIAVPFAPRVPDVLRAGGFIRDDLESARAKTLLEQQLGTPPSALVVAFHSDDLVAGTPPFETAAASAMRDIPSAPHVVRLISHLLRPRQISADGHTAYDVVLLDLPADDSPDALPILRERLRQAPGLTVELAGGPAFYGDVQTVSERDLQRSEIISLPLAALALLLGLGLGVDYSLLLTSRFREELSKRPADESDRVREAVRITVATAGRA